jgi:hypothetical protein
MSLFEQDVQPIILLRGQFLKNILYILHNAYKK